MKTLFLIPAPGLKVRNPVDKAALPEAGAVMPLDSYWRRRIACGDVIVGKPTAKKEEVKKSVEKEKNDV
jgi:hypothetical protein